ncbi:hypothetical protein [Burkholderia cenocepacia]|uniref:hypothetical protein n=1 Tax=Burkholderia cenocepacia TaxID=95486 RepID=UPI0020118AFE|nr:hypothetical protein [Burkholderia cenocepacia]
MSTLNFGTVDQCSVTLDTATLLGLKATYEDFAATGQDLHNFEICITDKNSGHARTGQCKPAREVDPLRHRAGNRRDSRDSRDEVTRSASGGVWITGARFS